MPQFTCQHTNQELSQESLDLHRKVLAQLGYGPRRYETDDNGEDVEIASFGHTFSDHLNFCHIKHDFSPHVRLCTHAANMPTVQNFEVALYRARNFKLARLLKKTQACWQDPKYREKFIADPCMDGITDNQTAATQFFVEGYTKLENTHARILDQFRRVVSEQEYLDVLDQMLDLRYERHNRRPNTWTCCPKAEIHPNDRGQVEET
jgi:hypothetical protein